MKKRFLGASWVAVVALLALTALPALAAPPDEAAGHWRYFTWVDDVREAGCNTFLTTHEYSEFTGTFEGESDSVSEIVLHCSGDVSYRTVLTFEEVTVDGRTGGLVLRANGRAQDPATHWEGHWVILSGSGELADLHGQGSWWGPGAGGPYLWGDIDYDGKVHFSGH